MNIVTNTSLKRFYNNLNEDIRNKIGSSVPLGTILPFTGEIAPYSYLLCQGQELNRSDYMDLFSVIDTKYGSSSSTTFKLPDLRGKVITGLDISQDEFNELGLTGGEKTHTLTVNEMPSHRHNVQYSMGLSNTEARLRLGDSSGSTTGNYGDPLTKTGGDQPHNNLQPYLTTNYIIKAKYDDFEVQERNQYSLDEQRIGTWYDGKPIYRRVFAGRASNNDKSVEISKGLAGFKDIIDVGGCIKTLTTNFNIFYIGSDSQAVIIRSNGTVNIYTNNEDFKNFDYIMTIDYTKVND